MQSSKLRRRTDNGASHGIYREERSGFAALEVASRPRFSCLTRSLVLEAGPTIGVFDLKAGTVVLEDEYPRDSLALS